MCNKSIDEEFRLYYSSTPERNLPETRCHRVGQKVTQKVLVNFLSDFHNFLVCFAVFMGDSDTDEDISVQAADVSNDKDDFDFYD